MDDQDHPHSSNHDTDDESVALLGTSPPRRRPPEFLEMWVNEARDRMKAPAQQPEQSMEVPAPQQPGQSMKAPASVPGQSKNQNGNYDNPQSSSLPLLFRSSVISKDKSDLELDEAEVLFCLSPPDSHRRPSLSIPEVPSNDAPEASNNQNDSEDEMDGNDEFRMDTDDELENEGRMRIPQDLEGRRHTSLKKSLFGKDR